MSAYKDKSQGFSFSYFNKPMMIRHQDDVKAAMLRDSLEEKQQENKKKVMDFIYKPFKKGSK